MDNREEWEEKESKRSKWDCQALIYDHFEIIRILLGIKVETSIKGKVERGGEKKKK